MARITGRSSPTTLLESPLSLPSGGWSGLWLNYTLTDSDNNVLSNNITSSTLLQPTDLAEGTIWLNTTIGDALGRTQIQAWVFTVDNSNSHAITIHHIGANHSEIWCVVGSLSSSFRVHGFGDDTNGVGSAEAECSWNNATWFSVQATGDLIYPSVEADNETSINLVCRGVDRLGNIGPSAWKNISIDGVKPAISSYPSTGVYLTPNSQLTVNLSDNVALYSGRIEVVWSNGALTRYANVFSGTNSLIANQIWSI